MSFIENKKEKTDSVSLLRRPWKSTEMPWSYSGPAINLMQFNGMPPATKPAIDGLSKPPIHVKRRLDVENFIPCKQLITEDRMASELSGMHISSNFISHDLEPTQTMEESEMHVSMTPSEMRERLKSAQKITVLEGVRRLSSDEIIPKLLLDKIESPCKALVLWKPPAKSESLDKLLTVYNNPATSKSNKSSNDTSDQKEDEEIEIEFETNGGYHFDTMDLDLE